MKKSRPRPLPALTAAGGAIFLTILLLARVPGGSDSSTNSTAQSRAFVAAASALPAPATALPAKRRDGNSSSGSAGIRPREARPVDAMTAARRREFLTVPGSWQSPEKNAEVAALKMYYRALQDLWLQYVLDDIPVLPQMLESLHAARRRLDTACSDFAQLTDDRRAELAVFESAGTFFFSVPRSPLAEVSGTDNSSGSPPPAALEFDAAITRYARGVLEELEFLADRNYTGMQQILQTGRRPPYAAVQSQQLEQRQSQLLLELTALASFTDTRAEWEHRHWDGYAAGLPIHTAYGTVKIPSKVPAAWLDQPSDSLR